jgi:6-phosphogluconolactonase
MPQPVIVTYSVLPAPEQLAAGAAQLFASVSAAAVKTRDVVRVAISGGNTPKRMFELLADRGQPYFLAVPWDKLQLFWVDERCVPPTHAESNYRMTNEALLSHVPLSSSQVHRMEGELDPEIAAARYESEIRNTFRLEGAEMPAFDLIFLGMGDDGHTASLFPHTEALDEMSRIAVANHVPQKDAWRVTLTWPVINHGREVAFLIQGEDKAQVLHDVMLGPYDPESKPAQLIRPGSGRLTLLLDSAAASKLPVPATSGAPGILELK